MVKPEDIPQDIWDAAEVIAKEATRDAMRDPLLPYFVTVAPHIARATLAERQNTRYLAAVLKEVVGVLRTEAPGTPLNNHKYDQIGIQANDAINKYGGR